MQSWIVCQFNIIIKGLLQTPLDAFCLFLLPFSCSRFWEQFSYEHAAHIVRLPVNIAFGDGDRDNLVCFSCGMVQMICTDVQSHILIHLMMFETELIPFCPLLFETLVKQVMNGSGWDIVKRASNTTTFIKICNQTSIRIFCTNQKLKQKMLSQSPSP